MRRNRGTKGMMRIVEVIMALFIMVFALSFANLLSITPASPKYEATELEKLGYNVLHDLDKQGLLSRFVYGINGVPEWSNLTAALRVNFPLNVYFNLTVSQLDKVFDGDMTNFTYPQVNPSPIVYGENDTFLLSNEVASITYTLVGYPTQSQYVYSPRILTLELSRGGTR